MGGCTGVCVFVCVGCGVGSEINLALWRGGGGGCPSEVCLFLGVEFTKVATLLNLLI